MCGEEPIELHPAEAALAGAQKPYSTAHLRSMRTYVASASAAPAKSNWKPAAQELCQLVVRLVRPH